MPSPGNQNDSPRPYLRAVRAAGAATPQHPRGCRGVFSSGTVRPGQWTVRQAESRVARCREAAGGVGPGGRSGGAWQRHGRRPVAGQLRRRSWALPDAGVLGSQLAGSDEPDHESEVIERLDGFGGPGDQRPGGGGGERLDDEVFALAEFAELRKFGGGDFLAQGP